MNLKFLLVVCGAFVLGVIVMAVLMVGRLSREHSFDPEMTGMNMPMPGMSKTTVPEMLLPNSPSAISCTQGIFVFSDNKLVKFDKSRLEKTGEIELTQGYIPSLGKKSYHVVKTASGVERILIIKLSQLLVVDTASCKVLRTIALPVVPSPSMGLQQGQRIAVGDSPYSFLDESTAESSNIVDLICGPRIAAVNYETGEITAIQNILVPGAP